MLARILSPLIVLLGLTNMPAITDAQFGACDYVQGIEVGQTYHIFNPGYPKNYVPGTNCRWTARSDRPIKMTCTVFYVPQSPQCHSHVVLIQTSTDPGKRYCGNGTLTVVSEGNQLVTTLYSSAESLESGKFLCTLETANASENNENNNNNGGNNDDSECKCGWKNPTRIVGGEETGINEYPMMAGLVNVENEIVFCGSTIINNKQVLTAAHCLLNVTAPMMGVLVGDHDLTKRDETKATKLFKVARFVIHPRYTTLQQDPFDIAIVTVDGTIQFNPQVGPACLPFQHAPDTFGGNLVDILGWGSLEFGDGQSSTLQKIRVPVLTNKECRRTYRTLGTNHLCTLAEGKDSCQFDSGGPILWHNPTSRRLVVVASVGSGGICADGTPSVNPRIGAHVDWILTQSPPDYQYCEDE